jgi:hypothetical protein
MTRRVPCPPAPGPLEGYAARFDDLFGSLAQRRGFRESLPEPLLRPGAGYFSACGSGTPDRPAQ